MDISTAQKLGELVGAQAVLVGSISDLRDDVSLNARLVDVETGTFLTAALVKLQKSPAIQSMLEKGQIMASSRKSKDQFSCTEEEKKHITKKPSISENVVEKSGFIFKSVYCKRERNGNH